MSTLLTTGIFNICMFSVCEFRIFIREDTVSCYMPLLVNVVHPNLSKMTNCRRTLNSKSKGVRHFTTFLQKICINTPSLYFVHFTDRVELFPIPEIFTVGYSS